MPTEYLLLGQGYATARYFSIFWHHNRSLQKPTVARFLFPLHSLPCYKTKASFDVEFFLSEKTALSKQQRKLLGRGGFMILMKR